MLWSPFISGVPWLMFILFIPARVKGWPAALRALMSRLVAVTLCLLPLALQLPPLESAAGQGECPPSHCPLSPSSSWINPHPGKDCLWEAQAGVLPAWSSASCPSPSPFLFAVRFGRRAGILEHLQVSFSEPVSPPEGE